MSKEKLKETIVRLSFQELGMSKERYRELKAECRKGQYNRETLLQACKGFPDGVAAFIIKSVTEGKSFDRMEYSELGRISVGRTDFYALRRRFYSNLYQILTERGIDF